MVRSAAAASMIAGAEASEVRPVMLADAEHVEADLIGQFDLFHQIGKPLRGLTISPVWGSGMRSPKL